MPSEYPTAKFASSSCKAPMRCNRYNFWTLMDGNQWKQHVFVLCQL
uniref:Uncharacterized protein n=1 Tax=Pristionchus pacificus TaxID=54126 RepID=A0A2A6CL74_PRIPA|eukprot:PDM78803.1 hypothetical protein PRIPAC_31382 [Pristionchus pacificus]